jgi:hypothetical protein
MNFESRNPATGELLGVVEDERFGLPPKPPVRIRVGQPSTLHPKDAEARSNSVSALN